LGRGLIVLLLAFVLLIGGIIGGCGGPAKGTADWHFNQGNNLAENSRYDEAIEEYNEAIRLNPEYAEAYNNRGLAYKEQGKKAEAIADFEKFITLTTNPQWIEMARQQIEELSE